MESPLLSALTSAEPGHMDASSLSRGRSAPSEHSAGFSDPFLGSASHRDQECAFCHSKRETLKSALDVKKCFTVVKCARKSIGRNTKLTVRVTGNFEDVCKSSSCSP